MSSWLSSADPQPLADGGAVSVGERKAGELFAEARCQPVWSSRDRDAVLRRLNTAEHPRWDWRLVSRLAGLVLLLSSGSVAGAGLAWRWWPALQPNVSTKIANEKVSPRPGRRGESFHRREPTVVPQIETEVAATIPSAPAPREVPVIKLRPRRVAKASAIPPVVPPVVPSAPLPAVIAPSAPPAEQEMLARVWRYLRRDHNASEALRLLESYEQAFPGGVLSQEALVARTEALLDLDRDQEALAVLELAAFAGPRLRVLRAELRVSAGRIAEALGDFSVAVENLAPVAGTTDLLERALHGKAACLGRLGRQQEASAAYADYLERFPFGPHAVAARAMLKDRGRP